MMGLVLIVGGGNMGCGIASISAVSGNQVVVVEPHANARAGGKRRVAEIVGELADNGLVDQEAARRSADSITFVETLESVEGDVAFVIEAIVEDLAAKQALFERMDALFAPDIPIVSNTSGLRITDIGQRVTHKHRIATAHFWFPAHLVPLVEVVMGDGTSPEIAKWVCDTLKSWGKAPVLVKRDLPGQLANRILQAVIREASNIVEMGLASAEDVDTAVKMGMGIRFPVWGPLEHVDAVGVDFCRKVQNTVLPDISGERKANNAFESLVTRGDLGYKTGKGFYDWDHKDMNRLEALRNDFIIHAVKFIKNQEEQRNE